MAFPKKNTRTIVVGGQTYQWHLNDPEFRYPWIVIQQQGAQGRLLFLDKGFFDIKPAIVRKAIEFARASGWNPSVVGSPTRVGRRETGFVLLPEPRNVPGNEAPAPVHNIGI